MKQDTLFDHYPQAHARSTDPSTSHRAAASISAARLRESQEEVLRVLRDYGPLCDCDLLTTYRETSELEQSDSGIRTRRAELVARGLVRDSGVRLRLPSNRATIQWEAVK